MRVNLHILHSTGRVLLTEIRISSVAAAEAAADDENEKENDERHDDEYPPVFANASSC